MSPARAAIRSTVASGIAPGIRPLPRSSTVPGQSATPGLSIAIPQSQSKTVEDPLDYLPFAPVSEYAKGEMIFGPGRPAEGLFLVVGGMVKVSRIAPDGTPVILDIYQTDEFFGESSFVSTNGGPEVAVALDDCRVMRWKIADIEEISTRKPALALALAHLMVRRTMEFSARIESFSADNILRRLVRALLRFSERIGQRTEDGGDLIPFTHELLSQYVGTSREIVTHYMNDLRKQGLVTYSRRGILLDRAAAAAWLKA